ncbi:MAG: DUF3592 domain-containing protein [Lachnospiraceae bacterium]|nr:DUF3592 domain-containing protein [Lachnospiraceae bacterium]
MPATNNFVIYMVSGIFYLVSLIFICVSVIISRFRAKKVKNCTCTTMGRVVDMKYEISHVGTDDNAPMSAWYPVFEYYVNGISIMRKSHFGTSKPAFQIGQPVTVFFNPAKPEEYYVKEEKTSSLLLKIFLIVGIVLGAIGSIITLFAL